MEETNNNMKLEIKKIKEKVEVKVEIEKIEQNIQKNKNKETQKKQIKIKRVIPLNIFQCWKTKQLDPGMKHAVESVKKTNPEFKHFLYDDHQCRDFLARECHPHVLRAYDHLVPGAYKADLWRLCILYKKGGIYLDIKLAPMHGFKFMDLVDREHFVKDRLPNSIYNAFMVCKPKNRFIFTCINAIIQNVIRKYYGDNALCPTGPCLLGRVRTAGKFRLNEDLVHALEGGKIMYKNKTVFRTTYPSYGKERVVAGLHYDNLWHKKRIYK